MIHHKKAYVPLEGHKGECTGKIRVQGPGLFAGKSSKHKTFASESSSFAITLVCVDTGMGMLLMECLGSLLLGIEMVLLLATSPASWDGGITSATKQRVLQIPCRGCFIRPFTVAGLGFKYFLTPWALRFGHPLRYPLLTALSKDEIGGLHKD